MNWNTLVDGLTPKWWRNLRMITWLRLLVSQVRDLHTQLVAYRTVTLYEMSLNGQVIMLELALNDRFDPIQRDIWIEGIDDPTQTFIFQKIEGRPPFYIHRKWQVAQAYVIDDLVAHAGGIWKAVADNTGSVPEIGSTDWTYERDFTPYLKNKGESLQPYDFIVWVPISLVFDLAEMRALIDRYKIASKRYIIQTF